MVEQPIRVAERVATWLREGWCRHTIFNLKLPMKKRWQETQRCLQLLADHAQTPLIVRARQLYHDREEITVYAGSVSRVVTHVSWRMNASHATSCTRHSAVIAPLDVNFT